LAEAVGKFSKIAGLSAWQWRVLVSAPFVLLLGWARLSSRGYVKTRALLVPWHDSGLSPDDQLQLARETAYALAVAVKYGPWWPRCLLRSLVLGWYLARLGVPFDLRLGVPAGKGGASAFEAHAWVEHAGVVLNDRQDIATEYRPFRAL